MGPRVHGIVCGFGFGLPARLQVALREVERHVVHLRGSKGMQAVWVRRAKAGLVWRPRWASHRHGWAQRGAVLVVRLGRGTVRLVAAVERRFWLLVHVHLAGCGRMSRSQRRRGRGPLYERGASVCRESEGQERLGRERVALMVCAGLW